MTQPSNRSSSTSSPQPSPDGAPGVLSRRGLLKRSAAWAAVLAAGDVAWATTPVAAQAPTVSAPVPAAAADNPPSHLAYQDASIAVTVDVRPVQDVTLIHCEFTDLTGDPETYELSFIDNKTGKESKPRTLALVPDTTSVVDYYGGLNRSFTVKLCPQSATTCLMLGPVAGPPAMTAMTAKAVGIRSVR